MRGTDPHTALFDEYSKRIDTALVLSILSDYDLSDSQQYASVRQILDDIRASVPDEEANFDPSGAGGDHFSIVGEDESSSARSGAAWRSQTDDTAQSLASDLDSLDFSENTVTGVLNEENVDRSYASELDALNLEGRETALIGIFPSLKPFDVKWTLKKCKGDAGKAIDELMTQAFLEESGTRSRGIDAFSEFGDNPRPRKGKGKKRKNVRTDEKETSPSTELPMPSKWDVGKQDVEFISDKTGIPIKQVQTLYNKNGASLSKTISSIIEAHVAMKVEPEDPMIKINASEFQEDFPSITTTHLEALLQITHPSINNARDLAKALTTTLATTTSPTSPIHLEFRHAPLNLDGGTPPKPKSHNAVSVSPTPLDAATAASVASTYTRARNLSFQQAASAYRKSKSDPLFGGAAAYYADRGHEHAAKAKIAERDAADARVASQSSKTQLDLHGVDVKNALRISKEGVTRWWHELEEARLGGGGRDRHGFKIITGIGRHSVDGRARLAPAIFKMLSAGGWKFEVWEGCFVVTGVRKK